MQNKISQYVATLFENKPNNPVINELQEEIICNLQEMYTDYITQGLNQEEAFEKVVKSIGNIDELIENTCPTPKFSKAQVIREKIFLCVCILVAFTTIMATPAIALADTYSFWESAFEIPYCILGVVSSITMIISIASVIRRKNDALQGLHQLNSWKNYYPARYKSYKLSIRTLWIILSITFVILTILTKTYILYYPSIHEYNYNFLNMSIVFPIGILAHKFIRTIFQLITN